MKALVELPRALRERFEPRGRFGERTLRAWDVRRRRDVVVKILDVTRAPTEGLARHGAAIQAGRRAGHPALVLPLEVILDDPSAPVAVYEVLDGQDLDALQVKLGALLWARAAELVCRCAEALAAVTKATGLAHRALKPGNVWITETGDVRLLDFGAAELGVGPTGARADGVFVEYRAPEQLDGSPGDARSDVYTLGVLLFETTTGVHPFAAPSAFKVAHNVLLQPVPALATLVPGMPAAAVREAEAVISRAIARRPEERFADAGELLRALDQARRTIGAPNHRPAPTPAPAPVTKPAAVAQDDDDHTTVLGLPVQRLFAKQEPAAAKPAVKAAVKEPASVEVPAAARVDGPEMLDERTEVGTKVPFALREAARSLPKPAPRAGPSAQGVTSDTVVASRTVKLPGAKEPAARTGPERVDARASGPERTLVLPDGPGPERTLVLPDGPDRAAPERTLALPDALAPGDSGDAPTNVHMRLPAANEPGASASRSHAPPSGLRAVAGAEASMDGSAAAGESEVAEVEASPGAWTSQRWLLLVNGLCALFILAGVVLLFVL